jgi:hypothetical protein
MAAQSGSVTHEAVHWLAMQNGVAMGSGQSEGTRHATQVLSPVRHTGFVGVSAHCGFESHSLHRPPAHAGRAVVGHARPGVTPLSTVHVWQTSPAQTGVASWHCELWVQLTH